MTILQDRADDARASAGPPGWDVVGDLTPPELLDMRSLAVLRRRIVAALVLVLLLCVAAYAYATVLYVIAQRQANTETQRSASLNGAAAKYAGITRLETTVSTIDAQLATLLKDDVDVPRTVAQVRAALPASMSIQSVTVTLDAAGATQDATSGSSSTGLDATGNPTIGTVTITGSGRGLDDLPSFVDRLSLVRGFVNVLPTSNQVDKAKSQFSVNLSLTDLLHTHRYDAPSGHK